MATTLGSGTARTTRWGGPATGLLALFLAGACTGTVGPGGGNGGPGGIDPMTGLPTLPPATPGTPTPLPDDAPTAGPIASRAAGSSRLVRLSHRQWENTMRDLLGLAEAPGLSKQFVTESIRTAFDTHGGDLEVSEQLWKDYHRAAGTLATQVVRDANRLNALLPPNAPADPEGRAKAFITSFGLRAYRRPLTEGEVNQYLAVFRQGSQMSMGGTVLADGLELVVALFLNSPHVLYRTELSTAVSSGRIVLSDYEVASRLSYGLLNTMPDAELFTAAGAKQLHTRDQVLAQARRLLESPKGIATVRDLHDQMIREVDPAELVRDVKLHPLFKPGMGADMKEETLAFVHDVIFDQQKSYFEILTAPYTMLNARLAPLYGVNVPAGSGDKFVKVALDGKQRAGLYTQLGFLAETATDYNPRPIKRGVHLSDHLLCNKVPPPPPEANQTPIPNRPGATNRQSFEAATEAPGSACVACHSTLINPLGFAFEHFDGLGRYRNDESGLPINAKATYQFAEGSKSFDGAVEFMKIIAEGKQAHECYARQMFEYVYGRSASDLDGALLSELGRRSRLKVPVKALMLDMVATETFLTRLP